MPWLEDDPAAQKWQTAFANALRLRIPAKQLTHPVEELASQYPLPGRHVAEILLQHKARKRSAEDPLLFQYAKQLLKGGQIAISDLLLAMLPGSQLHNGDHDSSQLQLTAVLPTCEERLLLLLGELSMAGGLSKASETTAGTAAALGKWMRAASEHESQKQLESSDLHTVPATSQGIYNALARLVISVFGKQAFRLVTNHSWWRTARPSLVSQMQTFDVQVLQWIQSPMSGQLQALSRLPPFLELDLDGRPVLSHEQVMSTLLQAANVPTARSRAGLFIWLNACLCGRPMTDDLTMLGHLQARYAGDNQTLTVQLLHAAFDVLTSAQLNGERPHDVNVIRSFICNKVPLLLAIICSFTGQIVMETCVQTAFLSIGMDPIPPISAGSSEATDMLKRTRLDFCQACVLHGVITENVSASISQTAPTPTKTAKLSKEALLAKQLNNLGAFEQLAGHLGKMDGNAGAVSGCIVELINQLSSNKDTMVLKNVCNVLIRHVHNMDIVLQYAQPAAVLMPLCALLKDWQHDQDQAEFAPEYEEFAAVLLFTLAIIHRYDIDLASTGVDISNAFVANVLGGASRSNALSELSEQQSQQLEKWQEGLFATDDQGEASGIGDDVMRNCPPQAFYGLVPALFEQSVLACKANVLKVQVFRSGLELLLEPFLLPSLATGLSWVAGHSWEDHGDVDILLQLLEKLLQPAGSSPEIKAMHRAVLSIVAEPLKHSLKDLARKRPDKQAASPMIEELEKLAGSRRTCFGRLSEVQEWNAHGGLDQCVHAAVQDLTAWAHSVTTVPPPRYPPRLLDTTCQVLGSNKVLDALVGEIRNASLADISVTLDVCASMVSGPGSWSDLLRHQLMLRVSDTGSMLSSTSDNAVALVRLSRSVEAQLAVPAALQLPAQQHEDQMMRELGLADAAVGVTSGENGGQATQLLGMDLDAALGGEMGASGDPMQGFSAMSAGEMQAGQPDDFLKDLDIAVQQQQQEQSQQQQQLSSDQTVDLDAGDEQPSADDDIFAGLDMSGDMADFGDDDLGF